MERVQESGGIPKLGSCGGGLTSPQPAEIDSWHSTEATHCHSLQRSRGLSPVQRTRQASKSGFRTNSWSFPQDHPREHR